MTRRHRTAACFLAVGLLAPAAPAGDPLAAELEAVMDGPDYKQAHWGVLIADAGTGDPVYARAADKLFAPASVTKLFSCAAALVALGPDHRFTTPVHRRGDLSADGRLTGDLVLVAQGDLLFGGRTGPGGTVAFADADHTYADGADPDHKLTAADPLAGVDDLARQVKAAGVAEVAGDVLVDDRRFEAARSTGSGPRAVGPVVVNDNVVDLLIEPAPSPGQPAKVAIRPDTAYVRADILVRTGEPGSEHKYDVLDDDPRNLVVRGTVPAGGKPVVKIVPVDRPAEFLRTLLIEALRRQGVRVAAPLVARPGGAGLPAPAEAAKLPRVAAHTSLPLKDALKVTLKVSHNLYASTLPLLVGAADGKTTLADGLRRQGAILRDLGVDAGAISFGGGAGGSLADKVTPRAAVRLVRAMRARPDWEAYKAALPVLGVDGTLATVVGPDSPARGKVAAKTGTYYWHDAMNDRTLLTSKALAGVLTTKAGRELVFAMFVNDVPLPKGVTPKREGKVLGRLCEIVAEHAPAGGR